HVAGQRAVELGVVGDRNRRRRQAVIIERGQKMVRFLAVLVLPEARGRGVVTDRGERIGNGTMGSREDMQLLWRAFSSERGERDHGLAQSADEIVRSIPVGVPEAPHGALAPRSIERLAPGACETRLDAIETFTKIDRAE